MSDPLQAMTSKNEKFSDTLATYQASIKVDDTTRETYMKSYGKTTLASEDLGMDAILKENYLLEYVMKNPEGFIKKRNTILKSIKDSTDIEFVKLYEQFTGNDYSLPPKEAHKMALQGANNYMVMSIHQLESMYPSKLEGQAYKTVLSKQQAQRIVDIGEEE